MNLVVNRILHEGGRGEGGGGWDEIDKTTVVRSTIVHRRRGE